MKKLKNRDFEEVLQAIRDAEIDVDRVLEAARLQRIEKESKRMSGEEKFYLILIIATFLTLLLMGPFGLTLLSHFR